MSYKVIEKNEYGVLVIDDEILQGISDVCRKCKYLSNCEDEWMKCIINTYYLPDSEAEKLESEKPTINCTTPDVVNLNYDTQKELIDLRVELRVEKEKSKALIKYLEDNIDCCKVEENHTDPVDTATYSMRIAYKSVLEFIKNQK